MMTMSSPPDAEPMQPPSAPENHAGCLPWAVLIATLALVFALGYRWLFLVLPELTVTTTPRWQIDLRETATYTLFVGLPGLLALLLLRGAGRRLWRGVGLALTLTAVHALVTGGLLVLDRALPWPGLPALTPSLASLLVAAAVAWRLRSVYAGARSPGPLLFGAGLGLLIGGGFALFGAPGTGLAALQALVDACAIAAIAAVLMTSIYAFAPDLPAARPRTVAMVAALTLTAVAPGLFAVRGFWLQGQILTFVLIFAGLPAILLLFITPAPRASGFWQGVLALLFCALLLPLLLTSGMEGDILFTESGFLLGWIFALLIAIATALLLTAVLFVMLVTAKARVRGWVARPAVMAGFAALSLALITAVYLASGGPGLQRDIFLLVLSEQADTTFAAAIAARDERTTAVYAHLSDHADTTQAALRARLADRGLPFTPFYLVNAIEVEGSTLARLQLARDPAVDRVLNSPHPRPRRAFAFLQPQDDLADLLAVPHTPGNLSWGVAQMEADRVWEEWGVDGQGIVVGNADSGVDWQHEALREGYLGGENAHDYTWFDPSAGSPVPVDTNGHGTHTSGITLGRGGIGVAPGARWIACRNLAQNLGNPADYLACMQFLFAPFSQGGDPLHDGDPRRGAHLTNNSWGCPPEEGCDNHTLAVAVEHLRHAGQLMVIAAGNEGPACSTIWSPASAEGGLSVGAVNASGQVTSFSSRGPASAPDGTLLILPDVVAPGDNIVSSQPGNRYAPASGTSMAGPHVAGLIALLWSANPDLIGDITATEQILRETARPAISPMGGVIACAPVTDDKNNAFGYGMVNAYTAVTRALTLKK